jgi:hypothetical protein
MTGYSAIAAMISFPLIAILYAMTVLKSNKGIMSKQS